MTHTGNAYRRWGVNSTDFDHLIGAFIAETQEFVQVIENNLLTLEQPATHPARTEAIKHLFRAAHSIKGAAAMFQCQDLSQAAHNLENCFAILRDRADLEQLAPETVTALLNGLDHLKALTDHIDDPNWQAEADSLAIAQVQQQLEAVYGKLEPPVPRPASQTPANQELVKAIFQHELPALLDRLEAELSQAQDEDLITTLKALSEVHYQLSGLSAALQMHDFGAIANQLEALASQPDLTAAQLKTQGWEIAQSLRQAREQVLNGEAVHIAQPHQPTATSQTETSIPDNPAPPVEPATSAQPEPAIASSAESNHWQRPTIRVEVERLTELVNLVGELVINRTNLELQDAQLRAEVKRLRQSIKDLHQSGGHLREEYDRMCIREPSSPEPIQAQSTTEPALHAFDPLELDRYTEFHTTAQGVIETSQAIAHSAGKIDHLSLQFESSLDQLRHITTHLRNRVMQLRVVPFSRAVDHLPRALRDLGRHYQKEVNLVLLGRDVKIDESLLDALRDPLVHLVRNAFDHGVESPEIRQALGKPAHGQIEIEAYHQGGQTVITVTDDGQGIDPEIIRQKVIEKGLIAPEQAQDLSTADLYEFLFWPGFSTVNQVTDLSGRGVGLDIVRTNLRQVRGSIRVDSRVGKGTSFILKLPLMLSITEALLVKIDHNIVAIPMDAVEEILHLQAQQIHMAGSQPMIGWRDEFIRLARLQDLLHFHQRAADPPSPQSTQEYMPVLVLTSSEGVVAIAVERLLGRQEIVIKPIPAPLSKPQGVVGSTILGDGRVVTILDADDLVGQFSPHANPAIAVNGRKTQTLAPVPETQPQILIVDDSYTIRQLLALTLTRARYRVAQAKDGQDAWEQLQAGLACDLIIADIEMPRMDGFDLLRSLKSHPQLSALPVAMLTSRSGNKHRQIATELGATYYFTKPYNEVHLLEAITQLLHHLPAIATVSRPS